MGPLVKAIIDTGKPTVVVYSSGKPITEPWISQRTTGLVQQFYPSEQGGHALADILFGEANPSGRLSVSFPYDVGTTPIYYDYLNSGRLINPGSVGDDGEINFGHQYVEDTPEPLYEFGYGKTYTTFSYSNLTLSPKQATLQDTITASLRVWNTGKRDGFEVVQLYVEDLISSVAVPNKQLKGFKKVFIKAGGVASIEIPVRVQDLGLWDIRMKYVVEPGEFRFWTGASSKDLRSRAILTVNEAV
jgi:beta-glucosidase